MSVDAEGTRSKASPQEAPAALDRTGALHGTEGRRIAPRSPRAALEPERVPVPKRYSQRARHPVVVVGNATLTGILLVGITVGTILAIGKQRYEEPGPLKEDKIVNIARGLGPRDIADLLYREGVIEHYWVFIGSVYALRANNDLKAGEYEFKRQASLRDVIDTIISGRVVRHWITLPEGLTSEQIVARLLENTVLSGTIREIPKEGTLLPETYDFKRGDSREQLIQRMQAAHRKVVAETWERRAPDLPLRTPDQLVILASIVEKETGRPEERPRVAAVFVNRLKLKMKLQSDPTIIYGLVGGKGSLGRPIMRSEIEQPTPYNTYVIDGLPPGPIANPGKASLEAAANPSGTRDLYFVSDGSGGHLFAETLEQHQRNVARLRQIEQQQRQAQPNDAASSASSFAPATPPPSSRTQPPQAGGSQPGGAQPGASRSRQGQPGSRP
jgi:UPF0755 protein